MEDLYADVVPLMRNCNSFSDLRQRHGQIKQRWVQDGLSSYELVRLYTREYNAIVEKYRQRIHHDIPSFENSVREYIRYREALENSPQEQRPSFDRCSFKLSTMLFYKNVAGELRAERGYVRFVRSSEYRCTSQTDHSYVIVDQLADSERAEQQHELFGTEPISVPTVYNNVSDAVRGVMSSLDLTVVPSGDEIINGLHPTTRETRPRERARILFAPFMVRRHTIRKFRKI